MGPRVHCVSLTVRIVHDKEHLSYTPTQSLVERTRQLGLPKFSSVQFGDHFCRTRTRTYYPWGELNQNLSCILHVGVKSVYMY